MKYQGTGICRALALHPDTGRRLMVGGGNSVRAKVGLPQSFPEATSDDMGSPPT